MFFFGGVVLIGWLVVGIESKVKVRRSARRRDGGSRTAKQNPKVAEAAP